MLWNLLFQETNEGLVKIGRSVNWNARLQVLNSQSPYEIVKVHTIVTENYLIVERHFQSLFNKKTDKRRMV